MSMQSQSCFACVPVDFFCVYPLLNLGFLYAIMGIYGCNVHWLKVIVSVTVNGEENQDCK